jgi:hypothetical protein
MLVVGWLVRGRGIRSRRGVWGVVVVGKGRCYAAFITTMNVATTTTMTHLRSSDIWVPIGYPPCLSDGWSLGRA